LVILEESEHVIVEVILRIENIKSFNTKAEVKVFSLYMYSFILVTDIFL